MIGRELIWRHAIRERRNSALGARIALAEARMRRRLAWLNGF